MQQEKFKMQKYLLKAGAIMLVLCCSVSLFGCAAKPTKELYLEAVEGNAKDNTIIFLENDSHKVATQYRQLSLTSNAPHTLNCES